MCQTSKKQSLIYSNQPWIISDVNPFTRQLWALVKKMIPMYFSVTFGKRKWRNEPKLVFLYLVTRLLEEVTLVSRHVRVCVCVSVCLCLCVRYISETIHLIYLIFCMKLICNKSKKITKGFFLENSYWGDMGPRGGVKMGKNSQK